MKDLVSVIMSTYNENLKWIKESVESVLFQSYTNIEFIIVLDNPNNLKMKELLESFSYKDARIHLIINKENLGLVKSLNIALSKCKGKYVARMDADDICSKDRIELQKTYLETNKLDFIFSGVSIINESSQYLYDTHQFELNYYQAKKLLEVTNISNHPTWFLKKEVYENLGGYREVSFCEDYDFTLRALIEGYKIGKMDKNILNYRARENGISQSNSLVQFLNARGIQQLYKKNKLNDFNEVKNVLEKSKIISNNKEREKFTKSSAIGSVFLNDYKTGRKIKGILSLSKSLLTSKYYFLKYIGFFRYRIIFNNIRKKSLN